MYRGIKQIPFIGWSKTTNPNEQPQSAHAKLTRISLSNHATAEQVCQVLGEHLV